ncbi:MAG: VCBS repeat-containing protein [Flavobacteriaceae bacterium]|nr:VCBS repeat-containing protein [Flavobacteriaceae bacterium]
MYKNLLFLSICLSIFSCKKDQSEINNDSTSESKPSTYLLYEKVGPDVSGLNFENTITHDVATRFNLFDYDYFYNGSGVGVEDLNNDGLKDIVFCGNQVENRVFLNKGDLIFEDITETANINQNKYWSSGVTFADVNSDGWMDIYISQGGPHEKANRRNVLLINQKDLTFKEAAAEYGLDDTGISTQSAFFDFDKDGDLDCVVMNENDYFGFDPDRFYNILSDKTLLKENSSHLYENRSGKFVDITENAGMLKPTYGLGLCVSDINDDSWPDIYIANDYYVPDAMYVNNGDGTFTDRIKETTKQVSFYGMGLDIADINSDNRKDIYVLDMASSDHIRSKTLMASMNVPRFNLLIDDLSLQYQYMFNSVQLNMGNDTYTNIAQFTGMAKTDWSWAALVFDTDHDTQEDIYVTNGYRRYASDNDSRIRINRAKQQYKGNVPLALKDQIYNELPSEKLPNILYRNNGDLKFEDVTALSELNEPSFSNGAAYSDLDQDGDLDLVVNNLDQEAFLFRNMTMENSGGNYLKIIPKGNLSESFAKATIINDGKKKTKESKRVRGYISAVDNSIHFGLGATKTIDSVRILWPSGKGQLLLNVDANTTITVNEDEAVLMPDASPPQDKWMNKVDLIDYTHRENSFNDFYKEVLLPYKQSTLGPGIAKGDVNGDGKEDLYFGGALNQAGQLFVQTDQGFETKQVSAFAADKNFEDMTALFVDIDGDLDEDLYVVSGGSEFVERSAQLADRIYLNDGQGNFTRMNASELKNYTISGKAVAKFDYDKDGDFDILVGNRIKPQKYPLHEPSILYRNDNGQLTNVTGEVAAEFEDFGMVNDIITTDFNSDGWTDFIVVGEWTHVGLFQNNQGTFSDISSQSDLDNQLGWWFNVTETDLNKDGKPDYLVGNVGKNIKFKVSPEKPLRVYADDFDDNGTHDVVLSKKYNDVFVPVRGKECSTMQMPFIAEKMPSYMEFANATLEDIYGEKIITAYRREVNQFKSVVLLNQGNGTFKTIELPNMAQTMPVLDAVSSDIDNDGFEDLVLVGNIHKTEVETPRLDNPYGLILISNQKDNYTVIGPEISGFYISGDAKSVEIVSVANQEYIVVACNDGPAEVFALSRLSK